MKIAVYGAGSMGTIMGALLAKAGYDVTLIDINKEHVDALNEKGATIIGYLELTQPVKAALPDEVTDTFDYIIYQTKPTQNESSLPNVARLLKTDGVVIVGQNGMPEEAVAEVVGQDRVVGCIIGWGATWMEPGVSKLTSPAELMDYHLAEIDNQVTDRLQEIVAIFNGAGNAHIIDDLQGGRFSKLIVNCSFSTTGAVVNGTFGDVIDSPKGIRCAAHIYNEAMAIANAAGYKLVPPVEGFDFNVLTFKTNEEMEELIPVFQFMVAEHRAIHTQILFDIAAGRYPEVFTTYNGVLMRLGKTYGIPTPVNEQVAATIHKMAIGELQPDSANIDLIELPDLS
ncbi:MAG: NAD(P)-binding domain-containing protein [Coriobacteriia bacterium]|nr:NAD(P)-binding domain-containing protein [Coriobacteriia bacterium]